MKTEFEFTLPRGYIDATGTLHKNGRMRLATALDEIEAIEHPQVQAKAAYLPVLLLGKVVTQLGDLSPITPRIIATLFAADLFYLQDLYLRLNGTETILLNTVCPHCQQELQVQAAPLD
jgi:hypothetical protein